MSSKLQDLSNKFNLLLTQYTDTYQSYINTIKSNNSSLTTVPNSAFLGQSNIDILNNSNIDLCKSSCAANSVCSGATFNNNLNSCTLTSGTGHIVSAPQSSAICQEALYYSYQLQEINIQLLNINKQMINVMNKNYSQIERTQKQIQLQEQSLQSNYQTLTKERIQIDGMIRQFEKNNTAYENSNLIVTSNYYSYIGLVLIVIFLIFILIKYSLLSQQRGGGLVSYIGKNNFLIYGLFVFVIIFNSLINK